jgi:hydroxyacylglutathione hydrolase
MSIFAVHANWDNWVYLHPYSAGQCCVVDPSDAACVMAALEKTRLKLTHILITHHHADHIGGVAALKKACNCRIYSPDPKRIDGTDTDVEDGDSLVLGDWTITVMAAPGHTTTGVCYYCTCPAESPVLYAGDTLFACGCGRLFEGSAETMYRSLQRLAALPDESRLCPGHDYTEENVRFALTIELDNAALQKKLEFVQNQNRAGQLTVPSTLGEEKKMNPFLKATDWKSFTYLRKQKDVY